MTSWRDVLPVHPAADLFPMMSPDELRSLGDDIKKNGLKSPIVVLRDRYASGNNAEQLLDGRNRLDAMAAAGINLLAPADDPYHPGGLDWGAVLSNLKWMVYADKTDPYAYVLSANIHRRHLTAEQKRELIAKVLRARPEASNRQIAQEVKADHKTVAQVRRAKEAAGEIPQLSKTTGADGKARTTTPKRPKVNVAEELKNNREAIDKALRLPGNASDRLLAEAADVDVRTIKAARQSLIDDPDSKLNVALAAFQALSDVEKVIFRQLIGARP
jgi:hypothetical protein